MVNYRICPRWHPHVTLVNVPINICQTQSQWLITVKYIHIYLSIYLSIFTSFYIPISYSVFIIAQWVGQKPCTSLHSLCTSCMIQYGIYQIIPGNIIAIRHQQPRCSAHNGNGPTTICCSVSLPTFPEFGCAVLNTNKLWQIPTNATVMEVRLLWYEWRTKLLTTCNGHGQSGWSPIGCEGLYFHGIYKNRVSVSGWSPIGCKGFYTLHKFEHSMSTPYYFSVLLILSVTHIYI